MSLQVWLPLNGDLHNQGISDITFSTATVAWNPSGKIGQALSELNSSVIGTCPALNGVTTFSLAFWCLPKTNSSITSNWCNIIALGSKNVDNTVSAEFRFESSYGNSYIISQHNNTGDPIGGGTSSLVSERDKWYHIVVVADNEAHTIRFYVNGIQLTSSGFLKTHNGGHLDGTIKLANETIDPDCLINDVRIYDHALSNKEIEEIAKGLALHYKLNDAVGFIDIIQNQNTYTVYNNYSSSGTTGTLTNLSEIFYGNVVRREVMTPNDTSVNNFRTSLYAHGVCGHRQTFLANTKYVFWIYYRPISHMDVRVGGTASNIGGWTEIPSVAIGNGWYRVGQYRNGTVTTDKTDNIFTSFYTPTAASGVPITIDWASPHLLQGTTEIPPYDYPSTIIQDSSSYGNKGTVIGSLETITPSPRYDCAMEFDGSSAIKVDNNNWMAQGAPELTVNIWAYMDNWSNWNGNRLYSCTEGGGFNIENTIANSLTFPICTYTNTAHSATGYIPTDSRVAILKTDLTSGWHMLTYIYTETECRCYLDGVLYQTKPYTSYGVYFNINGSRLFLGCEANGVNASGPYFTGQESDFRLYYTALTLEQIKELYNTSMSIDNNGNIHTRELVEV